MKQPKRLPCEIYEDDQFIFILDTHPETDEPYGIRILERNTKFGDRWATLDGYSRELSRSLQGDSDVGRDD